MATPLHFCKNSVSPVRLWGIGLCGRDGGCGGVDGDGRLADESEMGETCGVSEGR